MVPMASCGVRQFLWELHLSTDRAERVGIEVENAQGVTRQKLIDHLKIEIDIGETPRILGDHDRATRVLEKTADLFGSIGLMMLHSFTIPSVEVSTERRLFDVSLGTVTLSVLNVENEKNV